MNKKFAPGINFYKLVWAFAIFAIFGTIYEELLVVFHNLSETGQWLWEPRAGVFWGPFSPIYGIGAILMLLPLIKWPHLKKWQTFLLTAFIGGAFEYLAGVFEEVTMHARSWDYSDHFINFDGRTSLWIMCIWGILGVALVHGVWPRLSRWIESWPPKLGKYLTLALFVFLVIDCGVTNIALLRQDARAKGIAPSNPVEQFCDQHFTDDYIHHKIPNMHPLGR
jgi:uncharacterized membrane protein